MKRRFVWLILIALLLSNTAYALDMGDLWGGLTSIFSADDGKTYSVGETASADGISATLTKVMESNGGSGTTPEDGNVFLVCEFTIENNSEEELVISSVLCFSTECDGKSCTISLDGLSVAMLSGKVQLDTVIEPGKKQSGVVAYEVPQDWQELKIRFTPEAWGGNAMNFGVSR